MERGRQSLRRAVNQRQPTEAEATADRLSVGLGEIAVW